MIRYSKVYRNQATVIPKEIEKQKEFKTNDIIKWIINRSNKQVNIEIIPQNDIDEELIDEIIKTDDYVHIYRNISQRRHVVLPVEIERILDYNFKKDLLKWTISDDEILVEKIVKVSLLNISGILNKNREIR